MNPLSEPKTMFDDAICNAVPIWEVLKLSEIEYKEKYSKQRVVEEQAPPKETEGVDNDISKQTI